MRKILLVLCAIGIVLVFSACDMFLPKFVIPTATSSVAPTFTSVPTISVPVSSAAVQSVNNVRMTLYFDFGQYTGSYTGEVVNGFPHGQGNFAADETEDEVAWVYDGSWENGHMNGDGSTSWSDGFSETGVYQDDYLTGQGSEYIDGVLRYSGSYSGGIYDGYGTLYDYLGNVLYTGNFADGFLQETAQAHASRMEAFKAQCQPLTYGNYVSNPDAYMGQKVVYTGQIYYVYEYDSSDYYFDFYLTDSTGYDSVLVLYRLYEGERIFAENDTVTVYGVFEGTYTYQADDGTYVTAAQIEAWGIQ